jgi:hypothetical protein
MGAGRSKFAPLGHVKGEFSEMIIPVLRNSPK